jgi:PAS domain S-box-containing protein
MAVPNIRHAERDPARRLAARAPELLTRLQEATASLSHAATPEEVAAVIVEQAREALDATVSVFVVREGDALRLAGAHGLAEPVMERWVTFHVEARVPLAECIRTGDPVYIESHDGLGDAYPDLASETVSNRASASVPVAGADAVLGGLGLGFESERAFAEEERTFLRALAQQGAVALERARLYEAERLARLEAEAARSGQQFLARASALLASAFEPGTVLEQLARLAVPYVADWCFVHLVDDAGNITRAAFKRVDPANDALSEEIVRAVSMERDGGGVLADVLATGVSAFHPEATTELFAPGAEDPERLRAMLEPLGICSWMCVPLTRRGRILGAMSFVSSSSGRRFDGADLALAEDVGRIATMAIEHADLLQGERGARSQAEAGSERLALLAEVSVALARSLDYQASFAALGRLVVHRMADWCTIDVVDDDGRIGRVVVEHMDAGKLSWARELQERFPIDPDAPSGAPAAIRSGRSEMYPEITDEMLRQAARSPEELAVLRELGMRSAIVVPLNARGRTLGAISLVSTREGRRYGEEDLRLAELVARRAAVALDNARLFAWVRAAEQRYRTLVHSIEAIVWDADATSMQLTFVSDRAEQILGYPVDEWTKPDFWTRVLHPDDAEEVFRTASEAIAEGRDFSVEYRAIASDGRTVWLRSIARVECDDDGQPRWIRGISIDATERKVAEQRERTQHAVAQVLSEARTADDGLTRVLDAICTRLGWQVGNLWRVDRTAGVLRCTNAWSSDSSEVERFVELSRTSTFASGAGLPGRIWASGAPAWIPDIVTDVNFPRRQAAAEAGLHGGFGFPVHVRGELYGVMEFFSRGVEEPNVGLLESASAIGRQVGQFIQRVTAEEAVRFQNVLLESQSEAAIDGILAVSAEGRILFHNKRFAQMWGIPEDVLAAGSDEEALSAVAGALEDPEGFAARVRWLYDHPEESSRDEIRLTDGRIFDRWSAPLITEGFTYGRAWYFRDITTEKRMEGLLSESERRSALLAEASGVLASARDERSLVRELADRMVPAFADWCIVDLVGADGAVDRVAVAHRDPTMVDLAERVSVRRHYEIDPTAERGVPKVLRTGVTDYALDIPGSWLEQVAGHSDYADLLKSLGFRSYISAALSARGAVLGAITLVTSESGRSFEPSDVELTEEIARRASTAIDNLRLLNERSHVARTLQESLLPPHLPEIPGVRVAARYRAAGEGNEVGGDFYDVFPAAPRGWAVVVGDVCGKGPEAAALTALVRYTIRTLSLQARKPRRILWRLNEAILAQRSDGRFCTLVYARLDHGENGISMKVACGGHPLPLLLKADGRVTPVGRPGTLLGVFPEAASPEETVLLEPGDTCVFFTDGVYEARNEGDTFGEERLRELVASCAGLEPAAIAARIDQAVMEFQQGDQRDDIAVIVVQVAGAEPS